MKILTLTEESKTDILENLLKRSPNSYGKFESQVAEIIENVRAKKDAALFDYTRRFDGADISADTILVTDAEIKEAYENVDTKLLEVIKKHWSTSVPTTKNKNSTAGLIRKKTESS